MPDVERTGKCKRCGHRGKLRPSWAVCYPCFYAAQGRKPSPFRDRVRNGWLERKCRKCGDWALMSEFVRNAAVKHGRLYTCKVCHAAYKAAWRKKAAA